MNHSRHPADTDNIFAPFHLADPARPFVVAQLGQSLDGRIATVTGESRYINGSAALDHLHLLRAHVDAVVVGAGTVVADNPRLDVRRVHGQNPARVVIDPSGRLGPDFQCMQSESAARYLITGVAGADVPGVERIILPCENSIIAPAAMIDALFQRGMKRILIEGGARTISMFLDAGCLDRLHVLVAPLIIGSGRSGLEMEPVGVLALARRPLTRVHVFDDGDVLFDCDLRCAAKN